jgi:hypothetical protein
VSESFWHLPINNEHREDMKSKFADLRNAGGDRYGGASKGAAFLEYFINKKTNWIHLDIAGYFIYFFLFRPAYSRGTSGHISEGVTGFGTQTVLKYLYSYLYDLSNSVDDIFNSEDFIRPIVPSLDDFNAQTQAEQYNIKDDVFATSIENISPKTDNIKVENAMFGDKDMVNQDNLSNVKIPQHVIDNKPVIEDNINLKI